MIYAQGTFCILGSLCEKVKGVMITEDTMGKKHEFFTARYALIQGFYWASYCAFYSYAAVFLGDRGFSSSAIGILFAVANIFAVIMQPIVAAEVDKSDKISLRGIVSVMILIISALALCMCIVNSITWTIPILFVLIYMILQTVQPLNSSIGMECENNMNKINFGLARGTGSCIFAICSVLLGLYLRKFEVRTLPVIYLILFILEFISVFTFRYKDNRQSSHKNVGDGIKYTTEEAHTGLISFARCYPRFMLFLAGIIFVFFTHTMINNFAINMLENVGGNSTDMGMALGLAAFLELPAMAMFATIRKRTGVSKLLILSSIFFSIKHVLLYLAKSAGVVIGLHALQMPSYAVFLPASIYYVNAIMQKKDAVKGQAYVTIAITIGGIFSSLIGGHIIDQFGFNTLMFLGMIMSIIGSVLMIVATDNVK